MRRHESGPGWKTGEIMGFGWPRRVTHSPPCTKSPVIHAQGLRVCLLHPAFLTFSQLKCIYIRPHTRRLQGPGRTGPDIFRDPSETNPNIPQTGECVPGRSSHVSRSWFWGESHVRAVNAAEKSLSSFQAISHKVKVIMVFFLPSDGLIGWMAGDPCPEDA